MNDVPSDERASDHQFSRGSLLKGTLGVAALGALGASGASASAAQAGAAATPKRGGQLTLGFVGGGTAETFNPYAGANVIDGARIKSVFDALTNVGADLKPKPGLAVEWTPNKTATVWHVKLRSGVTFHDGKPFTADDVIYSLRAMTAKTSYGLPFVDGIDVKGLKKVGKLEVQIPLKYADATLRENFTYYNTFIVQDGEKDFRKPVGTGRFKFGSFTPGRQSILKANRDYWDHAPYIDELKIVSIDDDSARLNALVSGQINGMSQLPFLQAKAHQSTGDISILSAPGPQPMMFYMAVDKPPFDNLKVRQAMRLIVDRPGLISGAIAGYGTPGNDIVGKGLPFFASDLPQRKQDIEQAKSLLKSAGASDLRVVLHTSAIFPGFVESATLLAEQAAKAGVKIQIKQEPPSSYYNSSLLYLKMPFAETQWAVTSLKYFYLQALSSSAPYNETHWKSAPFNALLRKAIGTQDKAKATDYWHEIQKQQYDQGGYINWAQYNWVDALSPKVHGITPSAVAPMGNSQFQNAWIG